MNNRKYDIENNNSSWLLDTIEIIFITAVVVIIILGSNNKVRGNNYKVKASLALAIATSELGEEESKPTPKPKKTCSCSDQCTCGCNEYQPCRCSEGKVTSKAKPVKWHHYSFSGEMLPPLTTSTITNVPVMVIPQPVPQIRMYQQAPNYQPIIRSRPLQYLSLPQGGVRGC